MKQSTPVENSAQIRQSFLDFFTKKGHRIVPSTSLMPDAPNLLFTNAGMNPFVPHFLGERESPHKRIADTQKCIRAGGKHNDLEDVGFDTYHHTFFEMLGNWSFGDYFKRESIEWAWELLTTVWGFPKERLYATVYSPNAGDPASFDAEAYGIWRDLFEKEGLNPDIHIKKCAKKDNFWMMGETGPCGPCTEIHIDLTADGNTQGSLVNEGVPECIEIWNLVFIQFNALESGSFVPLAKKFVDTGMGFERVCGILATTNRFHDFTQTPSNYSSDLFQYLFAKIESLCGQKYTAEVPKNRNNLTPNERKDCSFRVIADHVRTLTFALADGILPSNEGRGYVLRRILRRGVLFGKRLGLPAGFFSQLAESVVEKMGAVFPELIAQKTFLQKVIGVEEKQFEATLDRGLQVFEKMAANGNHLSGAEAFALYDTYGFPLDLTQVLANERGINVDCEGFASAMEEQKQRARQAQKKVSVQVAEAAGEETLFVGYDSENLTDYETTLLQIINDGKNAFLVFDKTPFYAEMGGQEGDTGVCRCGDLELKIEDTVRFQQRIAHKIAIKGVDCERLASFIDQRVIASVDESRRKEIQRHHTAAHLLHNALRKVLGAHVAQAGSLVSAHGLRFDFSHFEALKPAQILEIEDLCNIQIRSALDVKNFEVPFNEKPKDCLAFFGEKYGDHVRVVQIGDISSELCGGTHVKNTGEIGFFKVVAESSIAAGTRRIEAVAGESAQALVATLWETTGELAGTLGCSREGVLARFHQLEDEKDVLRKSLQHTKQRLVEREYRELVARMHRSETLKWLVEECGDWDAETLRANAIRLCKEGQCDVVILGSVSSGKWTVVASCSQAAIAKGLQANTLLKNLLDKVGGKGGGKADSAMGGTANIEGFRTLLGDFRPF